ncbi:heat shock 70 kDa 17 isoform A [Micractinium conductrix]|uniref:Heat shock 70 kDa 17 isoform A n=1 Tax=Micractinium conductrix TaxID=554055 RepID=A0A2P6V2N2_9CHLO|nr:heat shock 70 kDa 17 isoform A [Micractinium conductrix]|eukprot:PSC68342.1 heat shock 70 kDa 17 isoform A [Micractinium conductrix]
MPATGRSGGGGARAAAAALLLVATALLVCPAPARGALLAIDLGAEFLKLSIVKPGRIPISIVINEMSKRKSPALVAFVDGDRLVGEEAAALSARYPERVYSRVLEWLGRPADDPRLAAQRKAAYRPYALGPAPNRTSPAALAVTTDTGETFSAEEVVASLLEYAKGLAEAAADGAPITDAVLAVPASFAPQQRQALLDAAKLAGLNVMGLIHSHAAAALQYGIERDFTNRTETIVLYDLGAASLQVALVSYSAYTDAKGASISQFDVRDVIWREDLGGEQLELVLMEHFADEFNAKLGGDQDVRSAPRAMAKLRKQVVRTKQILSANSEAPLSVEELWQDKDFRATITREKFEELAGDFWTKAAAPLRTLLERNNLTAGDVAAVELLGGTSRVPRLKQALSDVLGSRPLDMHLDADEAVVLGAGLFAANLSTTFRLRQFGMADKVPYSVSIQLDSESAPKVLVPAMKKLPTKRGVHLHNLTADSLSFTLSFDNSAGAVPCCARAFPLGAFNVSGIQEQVVAKYNESGKVSIHTRVDQSGLFHVDRADASVEVLEAVPPPPPPPAANATNGTAEGAAGAGNATEGAAANGTDAGSAAGGAAAGNATADAAADAAIAAAAGNATSAEPPLMRKRTVKVELTLEGGFLVPGMNRSEFDASRKVLRRLRAHDAAKREKAKARNDLEAYIIATRDKVEGNEEVTAVTTAEQREAFIGQLNDEEDWLYGDGEAAETAELKSQLRKLHETGDKIFARVSEAEMRPKVIDLSNETVELMRKAMNTWREIKPWLDTDEVAALAAQVDNFTAWLAGKQEEQGKLWAHQDPVLLSDDVTVKLAALQKAFTKLNNKRAPKPPPPPPPPKAEGNDTAPADGAAANATAPEGAPAGEQQEQQAEKDAAGKEEGGEEDAAPAHDELRTCRPRPSQIEMVRPDAFLAGTALLAVMAACLPSPAAAQRLFHPQGPGFVGVKNERELKLYQAIAAGLSTYSADELANRTRPDVPAGAVSVAAAAAPVVDATSQEVAAAIGNILAAAAIEAEVTGTLGDPKTFADGYPNDGTNRVALYRLPLSAGRPKGTCVFIHGCKHDPFSWFYKSPRCPMCTGLPEEVAHTKQCLARGYTVLALMSKNRAYRNRCFSAAGDPALSDMADSAAVIRAFTRRFGLAKRPIYMFGVSSGAGFAIKFPRQMRIQGIVSEVNQPDIDAWGLVDLKTNRFKVPMPPTVYYQMDRDLKTANQIAAAVKVFNRNKVPVGVVRSPVRNVTDLFLYERSMYIGKAQSRAIVGMLRKIGVLGKDGLIQFDVRVRRGWTKKLAKYLPWLKKGTVFNLVSDESQIWQELNMAWSWHEIVSDFVRPSLAWFESGGRANLDKLVKDMDLKGNIRCLTERVEGCPGVA